MPSERRPLELPTDYRLERDVVINSARVVNMYVIPAVKTVQSFAWVPVSGFDTPTEVGTGDVRNQFVFRGEMYVGVGEEIYSLDSLLVPTLVGTMNTDSGFLSITANENQVVFCDGTDVYVWDTLTSMFTTVDFVGQGITIQAGDICMIDNYIVVVSYGQQQFYVSNLNDANTYNPLNFALFQSNPDQLVGCDTLKRRVYLFGNYSTEVWYDAGAADFPLRRDNNALFEHGLASRDTVQEGFEIMLYLAQNQDGAAGVMMVQGTGTPEKISSPELDLYLQNVANLQDSEAILYKENGYTFYQLSFNEDNKTFLYVVETNKWSEVEMADGSRSPISSHAFFNNKHYVGMYDEPMLYELSYQNMTFRGELIRCFMYCPPIYDENNKRIRLDRIQLEAIQGLPSATLPNQAMFDQLNELVVKNKHPEVILSVSRDGGVTYSNGRRAQMGSVGQYNFRTMWTRLGCYRGRRIVLRFEFPYLVPFMVIGGYMIYEVLLQ